MRRHWSLAGTGIMALTNTSMRVVPRLFEKGHHAVPVPGHAASTRNENKSRHDIPSGGADAQKHSRNDNNSIERKTGPHGL